MVIAGRFDDFNKALRVAEIQLQNGVHLKRGRAYNLLIECSKQNNIEYARRLFDLMRYSKLDAIPVLADHLIRLFASCESLEEAYQIFSKVEKPSVHTWCAIIAAHTKLGHGEIGFQLYDRMILSGTQGNKYIYLAILKACTDMPCLNNGRQIHHQIVKDGIQSDITMANAVIDMYAKCGRLDEARKVFCNLPFRDIVSWNVLLAGCIQQADFELVLECFELMQVEGIKPNAVSWSAVIEGYTRHSEELLALYSFGKMQDIGIDPDRVTFLSILKACGNLGAIHQGRIIHDQVIKFGYQQATGVANALIDLYGKCCSLPESRRVLDLFPDRDVISWNTLITAYAQSGHFELAFQCLDCMQRDNIMPDEVTFIGILASCSHVGLVNELFEYIKFMDKNYGIKPHTKHYTCMIDLLGHAGLLDKANNVHQSINCDVISWISMLTACKRHGNVEFGKACFDQIVKLEPQNATAYALMSAIYNDAGRKKCAAVLNENYNGLHEATRVY